MAPSKVTSAKYEVEKFTGHNNFTLWQIQIQDVLVSQGLDAALGAKPDDVKDAEWTDICKRSLSLIRLHLAPDVLLQVLTEETSIALMDRLKQMYQKKFLST